MKTTARIVIKRLASREVVSWIAHRLASAVRRSSHNYSCQPYASRSYPSLAATQISYGLSICTGWGRASEHVPIILRHERTRSARSRFSCTIRDALAIKYHAHAKCIVETHAARCAWRCCRPLEVSYAPHSYQLPFENVEHVESRSFGGLMGFWTPLICTGILRRLGQQQGHVLRPRPRQDAEASVGLPVSYIKT